MPNYGAIIGKSIDTTKKHKWLWIYGLIIGAATGTGMGNFNISEGFDSEKMFQNLPPQLNQTKEILGNTVNTFSNWLTSVSHSNWIFLGLGFLGLFIIGIGISWVLSAWANGSLIGGLELAHQDKQSFSSNKQTDLKASSPIGLSYIKKMIILGLIQTLMSLALIFGLLIVFGVLTALAGFIGEAYQIIIVILGGTAFIFIFIQLTFTYIFAQRYLILEKRLSWHSWTSGWHLTFKKFFPSILMGFINGISVNAFGCVTNLFILIVLAIPGTIILMPLINGKIAFPQWPAILGIIPLVVIFFAANLLIRAIMVVFAASNWNLFWEEIKKTYDNK